ncbi:MAG: preprotein translocase subunit SecG [Alphaproteobacteria bacterium]|nr:preprotein translocase subunit SecG [Alphaproteobacteria bacterium]
MQAVILVIHLIVAVAMIGVIMLQKSEGGGLGMGGGGMSGFMTGRSTANLLTRITAGLAAAFMLTSIVLGLLASSQRKPHSIIDLPVSAPASAPAPASSAPAAPASPATPATPAAPETPSVPLAK